MEDRFSLRRVFERRGQPQCFRSPENEIFPTLSYSNFSNLDRGRKLKWDIILKCVKTKYERRPSPDPSDQVAADFCKLLGQFSGGDFKRSVLIFPNRWPQFTLRSASSLAQAFLSQTHLNVFIVAHAHPLFNSENVHELNSHLTGFSPLSEVAERVFVGCPVGLRERGSWGDEEVASSLPLHCARLIFLRMKKKVSVLPSEHSSKKSVSGIRSLMFPSPLPLPLLTVV